MAYCTVSEVKAAIDYPSSSAPISDANILSFIQQAEEEIENIYHTKFGNVEASGTTKATGTTANVIVWGLTDTEGSEFNASNYEDYVLWCYGGTGSGQYRKITGGGTANILVTPNLTTALDTTSTIRVVKLGFDDDTIDGTGTTKMITKKIPLIDLVELSINSTSVTPTNVYKYKSGKLQLKSAAESSTFLKSLPQLVSLKYVYGVYPIPKIIKRLCVCIAGIRSLIAQISGTYNDFTSVSLPGGFSGSKGEPYVNIRAALDSLQREAKGIVYGSGDGDQLGSDFRKYPSYRSFTNFG